MPDLPPPRYEGSFQLSDRRRLGYAEYGPATGRPVIWFHGTPGARRQIAPSARELACERDVRLIAIERPGIGSSTPHRYRSVVEWALDIERFCDALGVDRFAIAGLSGGGPYALACAHELPNRVVAVALLGGVAPSVGDEAAPGGLSRWLNVLAPLASLTRLPLSVVLPRVIPFLEGIGDQAVDFTARFFPPGDQRIFEDPRVRKMFVEDVVLASRRHMQAWLLDAVLFGKPWGFSLRDVKVPVHMFYGDADAIVPLAHGEHMAKLIPGALLRIRPDEGHLGGLGASEEVLEALLGHWDDDRGQG
jgi:pimeloyl-ACP methyl ester carboxylesterase